MGNEPQIILDTVWKEQKGERDPGGVFSTVEGFLTKWVVSDRSGRASFEVRQINQDTFEVAIEAGLGSRCKVFHSKAEVAAFVKNAGDPLNFRQSMKGRG